MEKKIWNIEKNMNKISFYGKKKVKFNESVENKIPYLSFMVIQYTWSQDKWDKSLVLFGVDSNSSAHVDNIKKYI